MQWPRAVEYLAELDTAISALPASPETTDALSALNAIETELEGSVDDNLPELTCGPISWLCDVLHLIR